MFKKRNRYFGLAVSLTYKKVKYVYAVKPEKVANHSAKSREPESFGNKKRQNSQQKF